MRVIPGAREVLERIRASGKPFALFTNGSHMAPEAFASELRGAGLPVGDDAAAHAALIRPDVSRAALGATRAFCRS